jgi:hypothetical protein
MIKDEALRLALKALEDLGNHDHICPQWPTYAEPENYPKCNCGYDQAITAIKAALEAKDKLVGWFGYSPAHDAWFHTNEGDDDSIPLYKAPPQRKPLTDDEIEELDMETSGTVHDFVRAIEAAHGIKGEA